MNIGNLTKKAKTIQTQNTIKQRNNTKIKKRDNQQKAKTIQT